MGIEKKEVEYAKEIDDVMSLVVELVKDFKAGKDAGAIASENLAGLMNAIAGIDQMPAELKGNLAVALSTIGYRSGDLAAALIG